jgi:hypothetical protein
MSRTHRITLLTVASLFGMSVLAPAAVATPDETTLQRALEAVEIGKEKAKGMAVDAPGQENRARGLERAAAAIAAAAERKAAREEATTAGDGPGRGLGRGHAADVHEILLGEGSPSDLPPHGETVRGLAHAFDTVKADHPGLKLGHSKNGKADGGGE